MTDREPVHDPVLTATVAPLDLLGLRYDVHHTRSGDPYAAFRWSTDGLPPLSCSVVIYDGAWRLVAHEPGLTIASDVLAARNDALDLVRGHHASGELGLHIVLAVRLRPSRLTADDLVDLLVHLAECVEFLREDMVHVPVLPRLSAAGGADALGLDETDTTVPTPGWVRVTTGAPDLEWEGVMNRPGLVDRLHEWAPVGTLVRLGSTIGARVTTVSGDLAVPDGKARCIADVQRLLGAARSSL